jgi:hypothetical protein
VTQQNSQESSRVAGSCLSILSSVLIASALRSGDSSRLDQWLMTSRQHMTAFARNTWSRLAQIRAAIVSWLSLTYSSVASGRRQLKSRLPERHTQRSSDSPPRVWRSGSLLVWADSNGRGDGLFRRNGHCPSLLPGEPVSPRPLLCMLLEAHHTVGFKEHAMVHCSA